MPDKEYPVCSPDDAPQMSSSTEGGQSSYQQPYGNAAQQSDVSQDDEPLQCLPGDEMSQSDAGGGSGDGTGDAGGAPDGEGGDDAEFWKTAPKLEIPWPPGEDEQSKHEIGWDNGPSYQFTTPEVKFPNNGKETLLEHSQDVPTPIPGLVLNFAVKSEYGLAFSAGAGLAIKKEGESKYSVTGNGKLTGKAAIGIVGSIGVGAGVPGLSVGVAGNLEGVLEAVLEGGVEVGMVYDNGDWAGTVGAPMSFNTALKVVPSASLYVTVFKFREELAKLTFGEWTIATAGIQWAPTAEYNGGWSNKTKDPELIGPQWGGPPEVTDEEGNKAA